MIKDIVINISQDFTKEEYAEYLINQINSLTDLCVKQHNTNDQWFLNFEDKLNEISVKDYNIEEK